MPGPGCRDATYVNKKKAVPNRDASMQFTERESASESARAREQFTQDSSSAGCIVSHVSVFIAQFSNRPAAGEAAWSLYVSNAILKNLSVSVCVACR